MSTPVRLYALLAWCWDRLPFRLRYLVVRLTQSSFTLGVAGIVVNERNEILLLRNRFGYSSTWNLPGGFVRRGEQLETALHREVREETGYEVEVVELVHLIMQRPGHCDALYLCRQHGGALNLDHREILEARFFPCGQLPISISAHHASSIATICHRLEADE